MTDGMDYFSSFEDERRRKSERAVTVSGAVFFASCCFFAFVLFQTFTANNAPRLSLNIGKKTVAESVITPQKPIVSAQKDAAQPAKKEQAAAPVSKQAGQPAPDAQPAGKETPAAPVKPEVQPAPASATLAARPVASAASAVETAPARSVEPAQKDAVSAEMPVIAAEKSELRENVKSEKEVTVVSSGAAEKIVEETVVVNEKTDGKNEKQEVLIIEKNMPETAPEPVFDRFAKLPPPDLIQGGLVESLPNFADIKTEEPQIAPLAVLKPLPELADKNGLPHVFKDKNGTKTPFGSYRRPAPAVLPPKTPVVAVLLSSTGLRDNTTQAAINTLSSDVSLSISPYAENVEKIVESARNAGHETFLDFPMQTGVFPSADPGPVGAVAGLPKRENLRRLHDVLAQKAAFIGVAGTIGESFSEQTSQLDDFTKELFERRLLYVGGSSAPAGKTPNILIPDVVLDGEFYRAAIRAKLEKARRIALKKGYALVRSSAPPIAILEIQKWMESFKPRGENGELPPEIVFVPVSYLADIVSKGQMK